MNTNIYVSTVTAYQLYYQLLLFVIYIYYYNLYCYLYSNYILIFIMFIIYYISYTIYIPITYILYCLYIHVVYYNINLDTIGFVNVYNIHILYTTTIPLPHHPYATIPM